MPINKQNSWGADLTVLTFADFNYLPGAYALFNSALLSGFAGKFELCIPENLPVAEVVMVPGMRVRQVANFPGHYIPGVHRLNCLLDLPPGKYLNLDSDIIIEQNCGFLVQAIDDGLLVSAESGEKYIQNDVFLFNQARLLGLDPRLEKAPYINYGFMGFSIPRDTSFIRQLVELCRDHLQGVEGYCRDRNWFFAEQDMLNVLIRQPGVRYYTVSDRVIEFGSSADVFFHRSYPPAHWSTFRPVDQAKYLSHGASLRRPWLEWKGIGSMAQALTKRTLYAQLYRRCKRRVFPYERGWVYYACVADGPIKASSWAERHGLPVCASPVWRALYGF